MFYHNICEAYSGVKWVGCHIVNMTCGAASDEKLDEIWFSVGMLQWTGSSLLQWCHNERDGVWNHQHLNCLLNRLFRCRPKKTSMLCITGLCEVNFWVWVWVWVWIHRWLVDSPHKGPITRKMLPFDGVIMITLYDGLAPFVISIKNCNPTKFSPQSESSHGWIFCILSVDGQIVLLPPDGEVIYRSMWISVWWISNHTNRWVSAIKFWALFLLTD